MKYFSKVERLKRKARRLYLAVHRIANEYDCGHSLLMVVSGRYSATVTEYEKVLGQLKELDPTFPKDRRPLL